jgi:myo-inositol 2-dehydrogenase/D-chiro-inositol 1-dehydrogenase
VTVAVGIIGTGIMGADHAATLHRYVSGARLAMVADLDLTRASAVAGEFGCAATDDPSGLIASADVDAVLIASHDATHPDFIRECVAAGKPVLCEKPLSPSLAESAALTRDIGEGAALVSLGFMRRFDPGYAALRAAVRDGTIGEPAIVHAVARTVTAGPGSTTESAIVNSAVHDFDIVPWLLDSPATEVSWQAPRPADEYHDPQLILLRTAGGTLVTIEVFLNGGYGYDIRCEVVGRSGVVSLAEPVRVVTDKTTRRSIPYAPDWRPRFADAYRLELQSWIDTISPRSWTYGPGQKPHLDANGRPQLQDRGGSGLASVWDGLVAGAVADAVVGSMRAGGGWTPVVVP